MPSTWKVTRSSRLTRVVQLELIWAIVAFALNGVAKDAKERLTKVLRTSIDEPTPFTLRATQATFVKLDKQDLRDVESTVYVLDDQSAYLKYLRGTGINIRKPGDIGPSDSHTYVPIWSGLARHQAKNGQNLPRNTLAKLAKQAGRSLPTSAAVAEGVQTAPTSKGRRRKGRSTSAGDHGGILYGKAKVDGVDQGMGFWARAVPVRRGKPLKAEMLNFSVGNDVTIKLEHIPAGELAQEIGTLHFTSAALTGSLIL